MPQVSTQIINDATGERVSAAYINNMGLVQQFKQALVKARIARVNLGQIIRKKMESVQKLVDARADLLMQLRAQVAAAYPEFAQSDLQTILVATRNDAQVQSLVANNEMQLAQGKQSLQIEMAEIDKLMSEVLAAEQNEVEVLSQYANFARSASTSVPSSEELMADLVTVENIPSVQEQASIVASLPAIEMLDSEAADMVTKEIAEISEQPVDMSLAVQDAGMVALTVPKAIPKWALYGGAALVVYMLIGGKR